MPSALVLKLVEEVKKLGPGGQAFIKLILTDPDTLTKTYEIVASPDGERAGIKCLDCGLTSWNSNDVREKYCGNCHEFHSIKAMMNKYPELTKHE